MVLYEAILAGQQWNAFSPGMYPANNPLNVQAHLTGCGFETRTAPGCRYNGMRRGQSEFAIFLYTISGSGILEYESKRHILHPGDAILLHVPHEHCYYFEPMAGIDHWTTFELAFTGAELLQNLKTLETSNGPVFPLDLKSEPIRKALNFMEFLHSTDTLSDAYQCSAFAYDFVMTLASLQYKGQIALRSDVEQMRKAEKFCAEHFFKDISVDDIARASGYSKFHFTRLFHQHFGMTPGRFLGDLRLKYAFRILQQRSDCSIKEVATLSGFNDESYFCRQFRKKYGIPPLAFRYSSEKSSSSIP